MLVNTLQVLLLLSFVFISLKVSELFFPLILIQKVSEFYKTGERQIMKVSEHQKQNVSEPKCVRIFWNRKLLGNWNCQKIWSCRRYLKVKGLDISSFWHIEVLKLKIKNYGTPLLTHSDYDTFQDWTKNAFFFLLRRKREEAAYIVGDKSVNNR